MLFGRGGTGGLINRVSKKAEIGEAFGSIDFGADSFGATDLAVDANFATSDSTAVRLNLHTDSLANHRDFYEGEWYGINPTVKIQVDDATDWGECRGLMLQAEIYGKDSFIRVASHDENGDILKKEYATMKEYPHAGEHEVITNILIKEAIEKGALDLLNEHNWYKS